MPKNSEGHWNWNLNSNATLLTLAVLALMVGTGVLALQQFQRFEETSVSVSQTHELIESIEQLETVLTETESELRGLLISGHRDIQDSLLAALETIPQQLRQLRYRSAVQFGQQDRLDVLDRLIHRRLTQIEEAMGLHSERGFEAAARQIRSRNWKQDIESIRSRLDQLRNDAERLLANRNRVLSANSRMTMLAVVIPSLLALACLVSAVGLVNRDIGRRMAAEDALRLSEAKFRRLAESNIIGIGVADFEGRVLQSNDVMLRMLGYSREDLLAGRVRWDTTTPPEYRVLDQRALHELRVNGVCTPYEKEYIRSDGRRVPALVGGAQLDSPEETAVGFLLDLSDRKRAEEDLRRSNEDLEQSLRQRTVELAAANVALRKEVEKRKRMEVAFDKEKQFIATLLEYAQVGIVACDERGTLTVFNRTTREWHQCAKLPQSLEQWAETGLLRSANGNSPLAAKEIPLFRALQGEIVRDCDVMIQTAGTAPRTVCVSAQPFTNREGTQCGAVTVMLDVTERKWLREQLHHAQKMEALGQLASGVAHDFNNLLTIIFGYSQMLVDSLHPNDRNRELIQEIYKASEQAGLLTLQLLAFSRKQVIEPRVLDLNSVVTEADKLLRRVINEDITLTTVLAPELWPVKADPGQIEQVIINLVVNARDAMPQGGELTIETANVTLDDGNSRSHADAKPGQYVMLSVRDTGCGMASATKARIFEPFFTTKDPGKGTGLGLATVFSIITHSRGHINVDSEPGCGTKFTIYLPRAGDEPLARKLLPAAPSSLYGTETVLVVEDDPAVRALSRFVLQAYGYSVLEASHGADAMRVRDEHPGPINMLLADVVMPGMSGRQVAEALRERYPSLKVLFLSGYSDDAVLLHGVHEGETAFLHKPFTPVALATKVRFVLDQ